MMKKRSSNIDHKIQDVFSNDESPFDGHAYPISSDQSSKSNKKVKRAHSAGSDGIEKSTPASPQNESVHGTHKASTVVAGEPKYHRDPSSWANPTMTEKAYKNTEFLNSSHARPLRILAEYEETMQRLAANGIKATVQFFGSARAKDREQYEAAKAKAEADLREADPGTPHYAAAEAALKKNAALEWMIPYMDKTRELARRLTLWSINSHLGHSAQTNGVSRNKSRERLEKLLTEANSTTAATKETEEDEQPEGEHVHTNARQNAVSLPAGWGRHLGASSTSSTASSSSAAVNKLQQPNSYRYPPHSTDGGGANQGYSSHAGLYVCTGGAGGFMEAANRGAADVPGGRSIGMGISLPFEKGLNPYVSDELAFEFHYFFTRKFAMAYHMQALVVAPGGFGTCDEMFEIMTLKQTGKMQKNLPIVLLGKEHWLKCIDWKAFSESGTIAQKDVDELLFTDDVDEAFEYITKALVMN